MLISVLNRSTYVKSNLSMIAKAKTGSKKKEEKEEGKREGV